MPCYARGTLVGAVLRSAEEVFQEATKLFGSGGKRVSMDQSVSSSSYLGLASMSCWNQTTRTKKRREEKKTDLKCLHRCSKKKSQQHNSHQLGQQLVWLQI